MSDNLYRQALSTRGFSFTRIMFHAFCLLRRPDGAAFFLAGMRRKFAFRQMECSCSAGGASDGLENTSKPSFTIRHGVAILFLVAYAARNSTAMVAGLSAGALIPMGLILFLSGVMSGLSGFGFSAVGAGCLLFIEPITDAPLLQTLSTSNQLLSVKQLREDMPKSWKRFWDGPGFCILGGLPGAFVGIWMLSHLPVRQLSLRVKSSTRMPSG
jgi:hypothetical protein